MVDGCSPLGGIRSDGEEEEEEEEGSKDTLENSDLEGHTLSCSLELMSNIGGKR